MDTTDGFRYQQWQELSRRIHRAIGGIPYRPILELMYFYTRRADDVLSLRESHIDYENDLITFPVCWRDVEAEITFKLDHRIAESITAHRQLQRIHQRGSRETNDLFDVSYSALHRKVRDASVVVDGELKPNIVRKSRVQHLLASGYHPEQIEYWMSATPSRLREKQDVASFVHEPLVLDDDELYGDSPDIPRQDDSYRSNDGSWSADSPNRPPLPPMLHDTDDVTTAVGRSVPDTLAYETRKILYNTPGFIEQETLVERLRRSGIVLSDDGKMPRLSKTLNLLVETGEVIRDGRRYGWDR